MTETIALGVLGGIVLGLVAVIAICVKKAWAWVFRRIPPDLEGVARATGRAATRAKTRTDAIVKAFRDGRSDE